MSRQSSEINADHAGMRVLRGFFKLASAGVLLALVLIDAVMVASVVRHGGHGAQDLILLVLLTAVCLVFYTAWFHVRPFRAGPEEPFELHEVPQSRATVLLEQAEQSTDVTANQAKIFASAIIRPATFRRRVVEEFTPDRRTLRKAATVDLDIPKRLGSMDGTVYVPVVLNQKGELLDDFHILHANDEETQWLSYRQYLSLATKVLHILLLSAHGFHQGQVLPNGARQAELLAVQAIVRRRDTRSDTPPDLSAAEEILKLPVANEKVRHIAVLFVQQLITHFAIVACIDEAGEMRRHRFKYTLTLTPGVKFGSDKSKRRWSFSGFVRIVFGARPVELNLDIANAATCESYHLHVHAPDDLYLAHQRIEGAGDILKRSADSAPTRPHCRFRRRLGQPHAHFYTRYMPTFREDERPVVRLRFFEVPPGSILRATITALAGLVILWLVGFVNSRFPDPGTDAPAFLLAFPAIAATWLGFDAPSRKLLEGTLSARVSLVVTAALSIAGTAVFMLHKSFGSTREWPRVFGGNSIFWVTDLGWAIIVCLALANAVRITYQCVIRTWEYSYLLTKKAE
ncbi:hypothetical protein [Saccharothrix sp. Mg75]|uniref:hypothetical protein n=1 Tax=Saccharothrix sp. Mg75 TaxID=3445357 RepID=UPI003EEE77AF